MKKNRKPTRTARNGAVRSLKLAEVVTDAGTQSRVALDEAVVADYAERMLEGDQFPAVTVFHDGSKFYLADGFHRVLACVRNEFRDVLAEVRKGTLKDAIMFSVAANKANGLRRSNNDKRRCVELALKSQPTWSNRRLAEWCGVHHELVGSVRQVEESATSPTPRTGLDGKRYGVRAGGGTHGTERTHGTKAGADDKTTATKERDWSVYPSISIRLDAGTAREFDSLLSSRPGMTASSLGAELLRSAIPLFKTKDAAKRAA